MLWDARNTDRESNIRMYKRIISVFQAKHNRGKKKCVCGGRREGNERALFLQQGPDQSS